jgi:hypothetical protein
MFLNLNLILKYEFNVYLNTLITASLDDENLF